MFLETRFGQRGLIPAQGRCGLSATPGAKAPAGLGEEEPRITPIRSQISILGDLIVELMLVTLMVLLFAALPTWPYTATGRAKYHRC